MQQWTIGRRAAPLLALLGIAVGFAACDDGGSGRARLNAPADGTLVGGTAGAAYDLQLVATGAPPFTWSLVAGAIPPGLALEVDTGRIRGTPTAAGQFPFTVEVRNAAGSDRRDLTITVAAAPTAPTILTASLADATVGQAYATTLLAGGSPPMTWSVVTGALPAGLALGAETGVLAGTPSTAGVATITIAATNAMGTDTRELTLTVLATPTAPSIQPPGELVAGVAQLPGATQGAVYLLGLQASGTAPIAWSVVAGALPAGIQLDATAGVLGGVPSAPGVATFTVQASNAVGHDEVACRLEVATAPTLSGVSPAAAPRGATVVLTGTGFTVGEPAAHLVTIDGHVAHVIAAAATELRVEVPVGASETAAVLLAGAAPGGDPVSLTVLDTDVGFVDSGATGGDHDGSSWRHAYTGLDAALAGGHDVLWIAGGVYKPGTEPRQSFTITTDQHLLGGFAGTEGSDAQRDPLANATVLSGDWLGNDPDEGSSAVDNSPHVVVVTGGSSRIDGLVIERGHAGPTDGGGANIRVWNASLVLRNCIVRYGRCDDGDGAGMWAGQSDVDVDRCVFFANRAELQTLSYGDGGGIYFLSCPDAECHRTVFEGNQANHGGGVFAMGAAVPIRACLFVDNQANIGGGAHGAPSNTLYHCTFVGNEAAMFGGGASVRDSGQGSVAIVGCLFAGNSAAGAGADIGIEQVVSISATIEDSRLTGGIDAIYYQQTFGTLGNGGGVVDLAPEFVDTQLPKGQDGLWGTADDGLILGPSSPLIDLGGTSILPTDLRGVIRPQGQHADIGAYESIVS